MSELSDVERAVAERLGVSEEAYQASKRPPPMSSEALIFEAYLVAERLGVSREDFVKHASIIKDGE